MDPEALTPETTPQEGEPTKGQPAQAPEIEGAVVETPTAQLTVAPTGTRQAFLNLRRQLTEPELANSGVQKLLLDQLDRADSDCERLAGYVERFHAADKQGAILEEKLKTQTAFDIMVGAGIAIGSAIIGLAPSFWDRSARGPISLTIGVFLVAGALVARLFRK